MTRGNKEAVSEKYFINEDLKLTFGKHKGLSIKDMMKSHPQYLIWAFNNTNRFNAYETEPELYSKLAEATMKMKSFGFKRVSGEAFDDDTYWTDEVMSGNIPWQYAEYDGDGIENG